MSTKEGSFKISTRRDTMFSYNEKKSNILLILWMDILMMPFYSWFLYIEQQIICFLLWNGEQQSSTNLIDWVCANFVLLWVNTFADYSKSFLLLEWLRLKFHFILQCLEKCYEDFLESHLQPAFALHEKWSFPL